MEDSALLAHASSMGFSVRTAPVLALDPAATRSLSSYEIGVPVSVSGSVVEVLCDHVPTAQEFAALERSSSFPVTITVAPAHIVDHARSLLSPSRASLLDVLSSVLQDEPSSTQVILSANSPVHARTLRGLVAVPAAGLVPASVLDVDLQVPSLLRCNDSSWRAQASGTDVVLSRVGERVLAPSALGLPRLALDLASPRPGLVLVSGLARSGRTSAAYSLAAHSHPEARVCSLLSESGLPEVSLEGLGTTSAAVVDFCNEPDMFVDGLRAACSAAMASRVFVTVSAPSMSAALAYAYSLFPQQLSSAYAGSVHTLLVPGARTAVQPVYAAAHSRAQVLAALPDFPLVDVPRAWEALGSEAALTTELALASAVRDGRVSLDEAFDASPDSSRLALALGGWQADSPQDLPSSVLG